MGVQRPITLFVHATKKGSMRMYQIHPPSAHAALRHNNHFFLAHQLVLLQVRLSLSASDDKPKSQPPTSFSSSSSSSNWLYLVTTLRQQGVDILARFVEDQKEQMFRLIRTEACEYLAFKTLFWLTATSIKTDNISYFVHFVSSCLYRPVTVDSI